MVLEKTLETPWATKRSNQSVPKEINPEYSLKGLMLKLTFQYLGHLMRRTDSVRISEAILPTLAMGFGAVRSQGQHRGPVSGVAEHLPGVSSALPVRRLSGRPVSSLL